MNDDAVPVPGSGFSHLGPDLTPRMVDVGKKAVSFRTARARAIVLLSEEVADAFREGNTRFSVLASDRDDPGTYRDIAGPKGSIFQTAVIAGIMAAKRTHEAIPLCHPIPLDGIDIELKFLDRTKIEIIAFAKAHHKTGVEMEALHAVSIAALTVYDMCKSLGHGMEIKEMKLLSKTGGKHDFFAES